MNEPTSLKSDPESMHALYCRLCNYKIPWSVSRLYAWELFCLNFTEADLIALIHHVRSKGKRGRSLIFRSLIAGPASIDFAIEDLQEARAESRKPLVNHARASVLRATGRNEEHTSKARHVSEIIAPTKTPEEMKAFFAKCRAEAGL